MSARAARRRTVAAFVQLTDLHLTDVQHPVRSEFMRVSGPGGWRPQEALTVPGAVSLIEQVNALPGGPATGAPLRFAITTGDNTDNNSRLELDWFLTLMNGGRITPDSGALGHYEGVQNCGDPLYWHPDSTLRDADKKLGYPYLPGFLAAALRPVTSPGLRLPWYSTIGNHDDLSTGVYGQNQGFFADFAVGDRKLMSLRPDAVARYSQPMREGQDATGEGLKQLLREHARHMRTVTPDARRAPFTVTDYLTAHLTAPGHGHGYTPDNLAAETLYYTFPISDGVLGISLDTTNHGGWYTGSIGTTQLRWLQDILTAHQNDYDHVIVFSHHHSAGMTNPVPDPARPTETRHTSAELIDLLGRFPSVRAWVNGHSHRNTITPHGTFWEITTASHIDFPHLARVLELTDNRDGTLSIFTTLIESRAPYATDPTDLSHTGLASLYRELAYNAPGAGRTLAGAARDRNTELLLRA